MQRRLTLDGTEQPLYHLLQEAVFAGAQIERAKLAKREQQQTRQDRASELRIRRAVEAIGDLPAEADETKRDPANPYQAFDGRVRTLPESGATLVLEQAEFVRLIRYVEQMPWPIQVVDFSTELEDRLERELLRSDKGEKEPVST